jgi:hypothetical protein
MLGLTMVTMDTLYIKRPYSLVTFDTLMFLTKVPLVIPSQCFDYCTIQLF